jgi:hypothetical protein
MPGWRDIELGAPEVARPGMARLNAARAAPLGTLRHDGFPRISQVGPYIAEGRRSSVPWHGQRRQVTCGETPRYVPHSVVPDPGSEEKN